MAITIAELLVTDVALDKLGARGITARDTLETLWNQHTVVSNRAGHPDRPQSSDRRLLVGRDGSGRTITLVIEATIEPTTWLVVTGWESTDAERILLA